MLGKQNHTGQFSLYQTRLDTLVSMNHPLPILAAQIDWAAIESSLSGYFSHTGRPSVPIRSIVGMLMLKRMFNESDESVVSRWVENPYWQHFTGEEYFQHEQPFDPSEFVHFRKRIGSEALEMVFSETVRLHEGADKEDEVQVDSTAQEKNITFPTDAKLRKKVIDKCNKIAKKEKIVQRQTYKRVSKKLLKDSYFGHHPKRRKSAESARRKLKTIGGRLIRELERKLPENRLLFYSKELTLYKKVLEQTRTSKDKIYSLHEPHTACIAKGKAGKPYEFGSKVVFVRGAKSGVITAACNFKGNPYDGKTLEETLAQSERVCNGHRPKVAVTDRGFRGKSKVADTQIVIPDSPAKIKQQTAYQKRKARKRFRGRAGIEPIIGHLKHDHRMVRNFLKGEIGDENNPLLAAIGFNLRSKYNQIARKVQFWLQTILHIFNTEMASAQRKIHFFCHQTFKLSF